MDCTLTWVVAIWHSLAPLPICALYSNSSCMGCHMTVISATELPGVSAQHGVPRVANHDVCQGHSLGAYTNGQNKKV